MHELLAFTPLAHYPWYSQLRLPNYYSRVLNVSIGVHIENDITSEDILFINLSISIFFQNSMNILWEDARAPRCKNKAMTVVETGRSAAASSTTVFCTHPVHRIREHWRNVRQLEIRNTGTWPSMDDDAVIVRIDDGRRRRHDPDGLLC